MTDSNIVPLKAPTAQKSWRRLGSYRLLADVVRGVIIKDGVRVENDQLQGTA